MPKPIRVLIVEDHDVVREGLKVLITADPGLAIAGEATNGFDAIRVAAEVKPDVVLMDLAMPNGSGLEATRKICSQATAPKVLVLSAYHDDESVNGAFSVGASGYLTKHSAAVELMEAVRRVSAGSQYCSPKLVKHLQKRIEDGCWWGPARRICNLTARENEVLSLVASGLSNKEVASQLAISTKTVEKHRQHIMGKLNIHEVAGLTRYALEKGLLDGPGPNYGLRAATGI